MHIFVYPLVLLYIVFRKYLDCLHLGRGLNLGAAGECNSKNFTAYVL